MPNHLIHIGFPKTGSTFLQEWFYLHPLLFYRPGGLAGFHNIYQLTDAVTHQTIDEVEYFVTSAEQLTAPTVSNSSTIGSGGPKIHDLIPTELAQTQVCNTLKVLYPNAKILVVTRGFKGIITSGYSEYIKNGGSITTNNFKSFSIDIENIGMNYSFIIETYEEAFGKENVIVLPYEILRDSQARFIAILEQRLNLPHTELSIGRINESLSRLELYWYPRMSYLLSRSLQPFGDRIKNAVYRRYVMRLRDNKFRKLIKIINHIAPGRELKPSEISDELLKYSKTNNNVGGIAAKLRDYPLYEPYLADYFLD